MPTCTFLNSEPSVEILMGTNSAIFVADLFLYSYERDFMDSLNHDNQADVIEAFNRLLDTSILLTVLILKAWLIKFIINWCFSFAPDFSKLFDAQGSPSSCSILNLLSPRFCFIRVFFMNHLFVLDDSLTS